MEEIPLRDPLQVGVVGADPGERGQAAHRPVQLPAGGVVIPALEQRRGLPVEEGDDPGAYRDSAGLPVHPLVACPRGAQEAHLRGIDPASSVPGDVKVIGRVLPFEHGHDRRWAAHRLRRPAARWPA